MIAYISLVSSAVDSAVCDTNSQLVWKTETGEVYGKTLQATCAFRERLLLFLFTRKFCLRVGSGKLTIHDVVRSQR